MREQLTTAELVDLVRRVFRPRASDRGLLILVDLPDESGAKDHPRWAARRAMAADWAARLSDARSELGLQRVSLAVYRNARRHNQDLPATAQLHAGGPLPSSSESLAGAAIPFGALFDEHQIVLAPTEFSATAPL